MGWSGRAPARKQGKLARGTKDEEHAMSPKLNSGIAVIGIDIGKNSFHVVGLDLSGSAAPPVHSERFRSGPRACRCHEAVKLNVAQSRILPPLANAVLEIIPLRLCIGPSSAARRLRRVGLGRQRVPLPRLRYTGPASAHRAQSSNAALPSVGEVTFVGSASRCLGPATCLGWLFSPRR